MPRPIPHPAMPAPTTPAPIGPPAAPFSMGDDEPGLRQCPRRLNETIQIVAEGEGFEPPVPFQVQRFSRPPVSTTHTSLRAGLQHFIVFHLLNAPLLPIGLSAGLNLCPVIRLLWSMFDTRLRLGTPPPQRHFTLTLLVIGVDRGDRRLRVRGFLPLKPNGDDIKKGASSAPNSKTV